MKLVTLLYALTTGVWLLQQPSPQPLTIIVRDATGTPLPGVSIDILVAGPPDEPFCQCTTDEQGQCEIQALPGEVYTIQFTGSWRTHDFVPLEQQNAGLFDDAPVNGFGVHFDPHGSPNTYILYVLGHTSDGKLIPLWDASRDPNKTPEPFMPPQGPGTPGLETVTLGAIDTETGLPLQETKMAGATPTAQVVIDIFDNTAPTLATDQPPPTPTVATEGGELSGGNLALGIGMLIGFIALLAGIALLSTRVRKPKSNH